MVREFHIDLLSCVFCRNIKLLFNNNTFLKLLFSLYFLFKNTIVHQKCLYLYQRRIMNIRSTLKQNGKFYIQACMKIITS